MFEGTRLLHIGVFIRHFANFRIFALDEFQLFRVEGDIVYHNQSLVFNNSSVDGCIETVTQCSCKAGTGKFQHLSALFTHLMVKLRDDD